VDDTAPRTPRTFVAINTGDEAPRFDWYLGTVDIEGVVWHVFEERPRG
jgi:hypothetical protein